MTGTTDEATAAGRPERYHVVVAGGGAAGLSGALLPGDSRRSVPVVDAAEPRNAPAARAQGVPTRDARAVTL